MALKDVDRLPKHRPGPTEGFAGIFVVLFVTFMAMAMASALLAMNWRTFLPGAEGARSMLEGVKSAVYTVMSQLS